jgi:hypothetical protein
MPAYCATELQGDKCTDILCQYRHDVLRCELCRRSFPAALLNQHESGKLHLSNVYLSDLPDEWDPVAIDPWTSLPSSPSQSAPFGPEHQIASPPSEGNTFTTVADPRVIVSGEDGLDFIVEGKRIATYLDFPVVSCNISIEKTDVMSSLSVEYMSLAHTPSQGQWCECFSTSIKKSHISFHSFSVSLNGPTDTVRKRKPRTIIVSFKAPHAGAFHAMLEINFSDKTRPYDREFAVTRELRGYASLPASASVGSAGNGDVPSVLEDMTENQDLGITVSPDFALDFYIESLRPSEPFATQTKKLVITRSLFDSSYPSVSFTAARIYSPEASMIE